MDLVTLNADVMKDNELIAEFMGITGKMGNWGSKGSFIGAELINTQYPLPYDEDWNELMPVVDKINDIGVWTIRPGFAAVENPKGELRPKHKFKFVRSDHDFEEVNGNPVDWIIVVHSVVVEFINWYNKQKQ